MINAERIEEMKRLSAEAKEGAWVTGKPLHAHKSYITQGSRLGRNIASAYHYEDAQFIAESRQFVLDIIAAYEAQAEEIARLQAEKKEMFHAGYAAAKKDMRKLSEMLAKEVD